MTQGTSGDITTDPQFVDSVGGDYRLQSTSPCINAGDDALVMGTTDLDGNARIVHGTVDMGAYEYYGLLSSSYIHISGMDGSTVNFDSSNGRLYTLWWSTNLVDGTWTSGASVSGDGTAKSLTGPAVSSPACFYQVKEQ